MPDIQSFIIYLIAAEVIISEGYIGYDYDEEFGEGEVYVDLKDSMGENRQLTLHPKEDQRFVNLVEADLDDNFLASIIDCADRAGYIVAHHTIVP